MDRHPLEGMARELVRAVVAMHLADVIEGRADADRFLDKVAALIERTFMDGVRFGAAEARRVDAVKKSEGGDA